MKPEQDSYPVFEANQVLTSRHLNDGFNYLDQQERRTRARLVGIGVACGLEVTPGVGGATIEVGKGCGVTSQGYLIVEPETLSLVAYRAGYRLPDALDYPTFRDAGGQQYPLWELFPAGEPDTVGLGSIAGFLDDKALVLFLELKQQGLRNCSPNNCDDKGSEVVATVRRLLIRREHLDAVIAEAGKLGDGLGSRDLEDLQLMQIGLPDLRLPRLLFPNANSLASSDVLVAFLNVFRDNRLVRETGKALTAAYRAFKPLLQEDYPDEPFGDFLAKFGFLDQTLVAGTTTSKQARFLQYYYDLFDDLLRAYDEFRWQAAGLLCACCPSVDLFPRHLMLGPLNAGQQSQAGIYRQGWLASPALSACAEKGRSVRLMFQRLVEMARSFTEAPQLAAGMKKIIDGIDPEIRITPSLRGGEPLAGRAIPHYYRYTGKPPLYQLWNGERTRRHRANQNLGYRAYEYQPAPPPFVSDPLSYDLEAYDFLRIEGHLGKPYRTVTRTLLQLKQLYRLPIAIVALRTGVYDEGQSVDLSRESCRFQDLEGLFDALREQLLSSLAEGVRYLYGIAMDGEETAKGLPGGTPKLALLQAYAPTFKHAASTVGAWYENYLALFQSRPYIDVDQNAIDANAVLRVYCELFVGTGDFPLPSRYFAHVVSVYYLSKLSEILPASLNALAYADFENKCQDLLGLIRFFRSDASNAIAKELQAFIPQEELIDHFDQVLYACPLGPVKSVHDEYLNRIRALKKRQFLVHFIEDHPGIEHKAGVPFGGTFVIVYHGAPPVSKLVNASEDVATRALGEAAPALAVDRRMAASSVSQELAEAITRISSNENLASNPDVHLLLGSLLGNPVADDSRVLSAKDKLRALLTAAVEELPVGAVIADFYLPYLCCSDCSPVQFVIPPIPPNFSVTVGCTNPAGYAKVAVKPKGGFPPYTVKLDDENHQALNNKLLLPAGSHTLLIRDSEGTESAPQTVIVPSHLSLGEPAYTCSEDYSRYQASIAIRGGHPPYRVNGQAIDGNQHTTETVANGTAVELEVLDSHDCSARTTFTHTCVRPCNFTLSLGCTDAEGFASAVVTPTGGLPPYTLKIDGGDYQALPEVLAMSAGEHTLTLRDVDGRESPAQTVSVAQQLSLGEPAFVCSEDGGTYTATLACAGGTPPYTVNGQSMAGTKPIYTTEPVGSGTSGEVEVVDSRGCSARVTFTHTCKIPCDLPCAGISLRRGYRLWLPDPDPDRPYTGFGVEVPAFSFEFPAGDSVDLSEKVTEIMRVDEVAQLNEKFADVVEGWLGRINTLIVEVTGKPDWLRLSYRPDLPGFLGILWIEYFECLKFDFRIQSFFRRLELSESLDAVYTPVASEVMVSGADQRVAIPAFDGSRFDKCNPENPPERLCAAKLDLSLSIDVSIDGRGAALTVVAVGEDRPISYLWEVEDGQPALANGESGWFDFADDEASSKRVRVTAFTRAGCRVSSERTVSFKDET
jgi:hypothetical protein